MIIQMRGIYKLHLALVSIGIRAVTDEVVDKEMKKVNVLL
jgi:hypothetical protein